MSEYVYIDARPEQLVGFQSPEQQLTDYDSLKSAFGVTEHDKPFERLAAAYPPDLIGEMEALYTSRREAIA